MRTCVIEKLNCERLVPYDPDDHSALVREGSVNNELVEVVAGQLKLRTHFDYQVKTDPGQVLWGKLEGSALIVVKDASIEPVKDGKAKVGETISKVIEGALTDDVFLAVTHVLRSMHLPGLLFLPPQPAPPEKTQKK
jgi:hypothetical protein